MAGRHPDGRPDPVLYLDADEGPQAMKIDELMPEPDEQLFVAGQKGSGKSTLIRKLLDKLPRDELVIVWDTKGEWKARRRWQTWRREQAPHLLLPHTNVRLLRPAVYIFRPHYPEYNDPRNERLLIGALKRGKCTLVIDEASDLSKGTWVLPSLGKVIRQGRWKKVRLIIGSQRPSGISALCMTEATKVAAFRMRKAEDRKRMATEVDPAMAAMPKGRYDFWWMDDRATDGREGAILITQQVDEAAKRKVQERIEKVG
jgi:energy-coupling factor transporter ATP-binding protein EcfA2